MENRHRKRCRKAIQQITHHAPDYTRYVYPYPHYQYHDVVWTAYPDPPRQGTYLTRVHIRPDTSPDTAKVTVEAKHTQNNNNTQVIVTATATRPVQDLSLIDCIKEAIIDAYNDARTITNNNHRQPSCN